MSAESEKPPTSSSSSSSSSSEFFPDRLIARVNVTPRRKAYTKPTKPIKLLKPIKSTSIRCTICGRSQADTVQYNCHLRSAHGLTIQKKADSHFCPLCYLPQQSKKRYVAHLASEHEQTLTIEEFTLESMQEFREWKEKIEFETNAYFSCHANEANDVYKPYYCNRSGAFKTKPADPEHRRRSLKVQGSCKIGALCPANIKLQKMPETNEYLVRFCSTHLGHSLDPNYLQLRRRPKDFVYVGKRQEFETRSFREQLRVPDEVAHDPVWLEHDYYSWRALIVAAEPPKPPEIPSVPKPKRKRRTKQEMLEANGRNRRLTTTITPAQRGSRAKRKARKDCLSDEDYGDYDDDGVFMDNSSNSQPPEPSKIDTLKESIREQIVMLDQLTMELQLRYQNCAHLDEPPATSSWQQRDQETRLGTIQLSNQQLIGILQSTIAKYDTTTTEDAEVKSQLQSIPQQAAAAAAVPYQSIYQPIVQYSQQPPQQYSPFGVPNPYHSVIHPAASTFQSNHFTSPQQFPFYS